MGHFFHQGGAKRGIFQHLGGGQGGRWLGGGVLGARGGRLPQVPPSVRTPLPFLICMLCNINIIRFDIMTVSLTILIK